MSAVIGEVRTVEKYRSKIMLSVHVRLPTSVLNVDIVKFRISGGQTVIRIEHCFNIFLAKFCICFLSINLKCVTRNNWMNMSPLFLLGFRQWDLLSGWDVFPEGRELLPRGGKVELAVLLGEFNRLKDHALQFVVVSDLKRILLIHKTMGSFEYACRVGCAEINACDYRRVDSS